MKTKTCFKLNNKTNIFGILALTFVLFISGCTNHSGTRELGVNYKNIGTVEATVIEKYKNSTRPLGYRNVVTLNYYYVTLKYKDIKITIDNEELFNKIKVNNRVKVDHYISNDGKDEIIEYNSN